MIPAVPFSIRVVLTLSLMLLAFFVEVLAILLAGLAGWISPELDEDCRRILRHQSRREPKP